MWFSVEEEAVYLFHCVLICSKCSGKLQETGAGQPGAAHPPHRLLVPGRMAQGFSHLLSNDCQKQLITSLDLSSQITKQYSHYALGRTELSVTPGI